MSGNFEPSLLFYLSGNFWEVDWTLVGGQRYHNKAECVNCEADFLLIVFQGSFTPSTTIQAKLRSTGTHTDSQWGYNHHGRCMSLISFR